MSAMHVPAPWAVCQNPKNGSWYKGQTIGAAKETDARRICDVWSIGPVQPGSIAEANARRIVACVNACEGLETDLIEKIHFDEAVMRSQVAMVSALFRAEAFIAGFENDDLQEGIDELLAEIRTAQKGGAA